MTMTLTITLPDSIGRLLTEHLDSYLRADAQVDAAIKAADWKAHRDALNERNLNAAGVMLLLQDDLKKLKTQEEARP